MTAPLRNLPISEKPPLVVRGMFGIGDNLHQRAVLRELMRDHDVTLITYYSDMYHDLAAEGLVLRMVEGGRIRDNGNAMTDRPREAGKVPELRLSYNPETILRYGNLLAAQFAACGLPMPAPPDFSLPVKPSWRRAARRLVGDTAGKPLLIYRPIVLNDVWRAPARSPDPRAYAQLFAAIRDQYFVVSVANLATGGEHIVGPEQDADLKLHRGEADFAALAGLFAEADMVFGNPGFVPVLAQAVGTPNVIVYGGNESFRTTNSVGAHLAPTLAIEPDRPCECHSRTHECDKRISIDPALERLMQFDRASRGARRPVPVAPEPRILVFATTYVDSADKLAMLDNWLTLHRRLNPECDVLLVDSASPVRRLFEQDASGVKVQAFAANIGHLARGGQDGWGRAFCAGLQAAIDGAYDYVVHIEGDSLLRRPVLPVIEWMRRQRIDVASVPVAGTRRPERNWVETGLMFFRVGYLGESGLIARYDWERRTPRPTPEAVLFGLIAEHLRMLPWRAERGDRNQITARNALQFDWITHCPVAAFDRVTRACAPPSMADGPVRINLGCGLNRLAGWQNYDSEVDIAKPLPFADRSADVIFAEHCVEHVDYYAAVAFFKECRRVLKPGGVLRVAVPSIEQIWKAGDQAYFDFVRRWAPSADVRGAMHAMLFAHGHRAAWTASLLEATLFYAGFDTVAPREPRISRHPELVDVEGHHLVIGERFNSIETIVCEAM